MVSELIAAAIVYVIFGFILRFGKIPVMLLGLTDIYVAAVLIFNFDMPLKMFFIWFHIIKGLVSIGGSIGMGHYLDWMGWIDMLTGMSLITTTFNLYLIVFAIIAFFTVVTYILKLKRLFLVGILLGAF